MRLMKPYIILNRCDNTPGCPVIEACPKNLFYFDYDVKKLLLNENKCSECGLCVLECEHEAVSLINRKGKLTNKSEEEYGIALAHRLKRHYGIEPSQIINDKKIKKIEKLKDIKEEKKVLLYVYGRWLGESYIGYSFLQEIKENLEIEIDDISFYKIHYPKLKMKFTELPAFLTIKEGKIINKYTGIKNPTYFIKELISNYI